MTCIGIPLSGIDVHVILPPVRTDLVKCMKCKPFSAFLDVFSFKKKEKKDRARMYISLESCICQYIS